MTIDEQQFTSKIPDILGRPQPKPGNRWGVKDGAAMVFQSELNIKKLIRMALAL